MKWQEGDSRGATEVAQASVNGPRAGSPSTEPVFVLCGGRSGSTLLRFLLDAHPDLACPPETNLPAMAVQLATVWSLIAGAPLSKERGDEPPMIPEEAIRGVRRTMDEMTGSYLARRGKTRYCDKSLGTARYTELLLRIYPETKFLCLYRHPMDMIASGIEACPWGLQGYGFDPYVASTGNSVWALASFWADNAAAGLAAEERFPESCYRVRYEDLVADPERIASGIFEFLGVAPAPGVSTQCFAPDRERSGPSDYKIWHTSQITAQSVGRGWSVPAGMIPPQVREQVSDLAGRLGYVPVDDQWGTAVVPADLRATGSQHPSPGAGTGAEPLPQAAILRDRIRAGLSRIDSQFTRRWGPCSTESFILVALPPVGADVGGGSLWRVDLATQAVTDVTGRTAESAETAWDIVGAADAWQAVLTGHTNLGVALRRCDLRYCETSDAGSVDPDTRVGMLADLLGLGSQWQTAEQAGEEPAEELASARSA